MALTLGKQFLDDLQWEAAEELGCAAVHGEGVQGTLCSKMSWRSPLFGEYLWYRTLDKARYRLHGEEILSSMFSQFKCLCDCCCLCFHALLGIPTVQAMAPWISTGWATPVLSQRMAKWICLSFCTLGRNAGSMTCVHCSPFSLPESCSLDESETFPLPRRASLPC